MMGNRPEYLAFTMGFAKAGITIALINTNLTGSLLAHAISISTIRLLVISVDMKSLWNGITPINHSIDLGVWWFSDNLISKTNFLSNCMLQNVHESDLTLEMLSNMPETRPNPNLRSSVTSHTPLYYIFTSGTTGPSKAAKFSHRRFIGAAITWSGPSNLITGDKYYISLPLYHGYLIKFKMD